MITSIYGLLDWQFWAYGILFFAFVWLVLRGLGYLWLRTLPTTHQSFFDWLIHQSLLIILGLVSFTILGFIFAQQNLRILQWITMGMGLLGSLLLHRHASKTRQKLSQAEKITLGIIGIGSILQLIAIAGSGLRFGDQIRFYFTNAQDGMMHLAFARSLVTVFPPVRPELLNLPLTNYHYFTDLLLAEQARLLGIPIAHAFFQYWPLVLTLLAGIFITATIRELSRDAKAQWWGLLIWYCSGELAYIWNFVLHHRLNWNVATIENSADQFLNMPQMFAKVLIFAAYYSAVRWYREQHQKSWFFSALILIITATGFKVYFGLFNMALVLAILVFGVMAKRIASVPRNQFVSALTSLILPVILALVATAAIFLAVSGKESRLDWVPLAWPKLLISSEHLNFVDWWLRMQVYEAAQSWKGIGALNAIAIVIALTSIVGTKLIGLWHFKPSRHQWWWQLPIALAVISATTIGFNTLQSPGGFNTYNFIIVAIQPLVITTALVLAHWWNKNLAGKVIVAILLLSGTLRPVANSVKYVSAQLAHRADATYTSSQLEALSWLATHSSSDSSVQAVPSNQQNQQSAFISFFAERPTALAAENITVSHNLDYKSRHAILSQAFAVSDWQLLRANLTQLGINYLYIDRTRDQDFINRVPGLLEHSVYQNETTALIAL